MLDPNDRLIQPSERRGSLTDRRIAILGLVATIIGAAAAVAVVPEFRCWALSDGCPSEVPPSPRREPLPDPDLAAVEKLKSIHVVYWKKAPTTARSRPRSRLIN
jgi:hypothetical protein